MRNRDVFAAFFGGALLGGIAALLLAPQSGEETRKQIGDAARKGRDKVLDAVDAIKNEYELKKEEVLEAIESARNRYQDTKEDLSEEMKAALECARNEYDAIGKKLAKALNKK